MSPRIELRHRFTFEAAHSLPNVPADHKCRRLHGHSFAAEVAVAGEVDPRFGWVVDYAEIKRAVEPLRERLDHRHLNEIEGLDNPTSEVLAVWLWRALEGRLPLFEIEVAETADSRCAVRG